MSASIDHIDALAASIKGKLHEGACPAQGALGELAYIQLAYPESNTWEAWMYAWSDQLTAAQVASWFSELGCSNLNIFHQLHDPDNDILDGRCTLDGVRPLMIYFQPGVQS